VTTDQQQVAANAKATAWLADRLEAAGYDGNATAEAAHVVRELLAHGLAPVPKPIPLRPAGPIASEQVRAEAKRHVADAVAAVREKRTTVNPPNEESDR
jgi:hypothetical protein